MKGGFCYFMWILINKCFKVYVYFNLRYFCDNSFIVWSKIKIILIRFYIGFIFLFLYYYIIVKFNIFLYKINMLISIIIIMWLNIVYFIMCLYVWCKLNVLIFVIFENM